MKLFERGHDLHLLKITQGFFLGIACAATAAIAMPTQEPEVRVVEKSVVKVVEKPVEVKKPVYLSKHDQQQIKCMAENTYFEAAHEPYKGRIAVNNVVLNRVKDDSATIQLLCFYS